MRTKWLSITLAVVALSLFGAYAWLGPVFTMYDSCECGRRQEWKGFEECAQLRGRRFMFHVTSPGIPGHEHRYWDAKYSQSSILGVVACSVGLASLAVELRRRGLAPSAASFAITWIVYCLTMQGLSPPPVMDRGPSARLHSEPCQSVTCKPCRSPYE